MSEAEVTQRERYRIADLTLEVDTARLLRRGAEIPLPKLSFDLLTALARRAPAVVTFDQLMDDVWGDVIVSPETVTQRVKLVRDALGDDSANPVYVAPVRGRGYRLLPAIEPITTGKTATLSSRWQHWLGAALLLMVAIFAIWQKRDGPPVVANIDQRAIAILPFVNMSNEKDNAVFVAGIHDDVLTKVSQIGALRVISRTSVELHDNEQSIPDIAQSLGVSTVLEGSVQRIDGNVRINVQLIDGETDHHLWSETYDREVTTANVFAIQSDIATQIADNLRAALSEQELQRLRRPPTNNFAAYEAYQAGRQLQRNRNTTELELARRQFEMAIKLDPGYAHAYLGLAETLRLQSSFGTLPGAEAMPQIEALLEKALLLDGDLGEAYAARGTLHASRFDFLAAEADFETARQLAPNHSATYTAYARMLSFRNRNEDALANYQTARLLDPLSGSANSDLAYALLYTGRYDSALAQFQYTVDVAPRYAGGYRGIAELNWTVLGRLDEAYAWRLKILELDPGDPVNPAVIGLICLDLGDAALAESWIERSLSLGAERRRPYWAKEALHLYRGEHEESLEYARRVRDIDPRFRFSVTHLRNDDVRTGRIDSAIDRYRTLFPEFLDAPDPAIEFYNYIAAIDISYLLQHNGNEQRAAMLQQRSLRALDDIRRLGSRGFAIADIEIYAMQGKRDLALATLREAVEGGWRMHWWFWLDHSPNLDNIRADPEFAAIRELLLADMATQLQRVKGLEPAR